MDTAAAAHLPPPRFLMEYPTVAKTATLRPSDRRRLRQPPWDQEGDAAADRGGTLARLAELVYLDESSVVCPARPVLISTPKTHGYRTAR